MTQERRRRSLGLLLGMLVASFALAPTAFAEDPEERIRALERENDAIRAELEDQRALLERVSRQNELLESGDLPPVSGKDGLFSVMSKVPIEITGFLKADTLWNDARVNSTSAPRFAASDPNHSDDQYTATIQHSRLIAKLGAIDLGGGRSLRGHIEMDLFNLADSGDTNFNGNQLRTRQLFAEVKGGHWSVLLGQAWDLFSPLNVTSTNTNGNYWFGGNAGFRRPQLRVKTWFSPVEGHELSFSASVNSNIGVTVTDGGRTLNSGRDAGIPVLEAQVEYSFPGLVDTIRIGASGLWGEEDVDGVRDDISQWALGAHIVLPIVDWLTVQGEVHTGYNTDAFLMGGGINVATGEGVSADSGWVQVTLAPLDRVTVSGLFGLEDLDADDLTAGSRSRNRVIGANLYYRLFSQLKVGLEFQNFETRYVGMSEENASLGWVSGIFSF